MRGLAAGRQGAGSAVDQADGPGAASATGRAQRSDAARNDARVLDAAREALDESGPQACMEEIATRAGVGVGSIYRRFPSKEALIDAVVGDVMSDLAAASDRALAMAGGAGLVSFVVALGESFALHRRCAALMLGRGDEDGIERIREAIEELTSRAVGAGELGPQTTCGDVMALIWSLRALITMTGEVAPNAWRRHLDIHLAGMRAGGSLSPVPAMTVDQVRAASS